MEAPLHVLVGTLVIAEANTRITHKIIGLCRIKYIYFKTYVCIYYASIDGKVVVKRAMGLGLGNDQALVVWCVFFLVPHYLYLEECVYASAGV